MAYIVRDEHGLLFQASSKCFAASSAFEAKVLALDWAVLEATRQNWRNFIFSSDSLQMIKTIKAGKEPGGWTTRIQVKQIRHHLGSK